MISIEPPWNPMAFMRMSRSWTMGVAKTERPIVAQALSAIKTKTADGRRRTAANGLLLILRFSSLASEVVPPFEPLRDFLLESERGRLVEHRVGDFIRKIILRQISLRHAVRILVPGPVPPLLHQLGGRVADVFGHLRGGRVAGSGEGGAPCQVHAIRLRRGREVHRSLGEGQLALGRAEKVIRITDRKS